MRQRRICGLRKAGKPFFIPGIEPVMRVVRRKKDMKVRVERARRKLHQQQRPMNRKSDQNNSQQRNRTRVACVWRHAVHTPVPIANTLDSKNGIRVCADLETRTTVCILRAEKANLSVLVASDKSRKTFHAGGSLLEAL